VVADAFGPLAPTGGQPPGIGRCPCPSVRGPGDVGFAVGTIALRPPECVVAFVGHGDDFGPGDDPPTFEFGLDETGCAEVVSPSGGSEDAADPS
jgi:hypothetical protein